MGLNVTIRDLFSPLKNKRLIILTLLANFVAVPLFAFILIYIFPINTEMAAGLILVSIAAGAPSTPKVAEFTGGNIAYAVSMTVLMTVVTIVLMPFLLPYLLEGVTMDPTKVAVNLWSLSHPRCRRHPCPGQGSDNCRKTILKFMH